MIRILTTIALSALLAGTPALAQPAQPLSLEHRTALRCSAAFAIVATLQQQGGAKEYPAMAERGREYFVRANARVMEETGMDRAAVSAQLKAEAQDLAGDPARLEAVMPACLLLLNSSGI
ncbi:MAG: hypothetical protein R3E18_11550 [Sphingomonadaceae bacterium]